MADITSTCTFYANTQGQVKVIDVVLPAAAATGDTIDFNSDVADGRGQKIKTILSTFMQDDLGATVVATFVPATGIVTLGTITTGIHNLTVRGL